MKQLLLFFALIAMMGLHSCGNQTKQMPTDGSDTATANPYSLEGMNLKGPVKTMTESIFTANIWEETRYEFAQDGHLTAIIQDKSSCGDQMIVHFDAKGAVVDTTYDLSGGCYDPADDLVVMDEMPEPEIYTGDYSEKTDDHYISAKFNEKNMMTNYHANDGVASLTMQFLYEADQTTLSEIKFELSNEDGNLTREYVIAQKDAYGNPTQWAISAPQEPFPVEIIPIVDELIPAMYIKTASYEYYK